MKADEIYGTKNPTPHRILLDTRFELPFGELPAPPCVFYHEPLWAAAAAFRLNQSWMLLKGQVCFLLKCQQSER